MAEFVSREAKGPGYRGPPNQRTTRGPEDHRTNKMPKQENPKLNSLPAVVMKRAFLLSSLSGLGRVPQLLNYIVTDVASELQALNSTMASIALL